MLVEEAERLDLRLIMRGRRTQAVRWVVTVGSVRCRVDLTAAVLQIDDQAHVQTVRLTHTRPHFGGVRWWCRCDGCERRLAVLHRPPGYHRFGCRTCLGLDYATARADRVERARLAAVRARARLEGRGGLYAPLPPRPAGMAPRTWDRLTRRLTAAQERYEDALAVGFRRRWGVPTTEALR